VRKGKKQIEELLHGNVGIESAEDFAAPRSNQPSSRCQHGTQLTLTKERSALKKGLTGPALLSRWEKRGRGGTEDETVKPLNGVQRVQVPHGQSEHAGR
jgi:hypothetical protein